MTIHVALSDDESTVVSVYSCQQDHTVEISDDDARYAEYYALLPEDVQRGLPAPVNPAHEK